jgi:TnpA family transposase
MAANSLYPYEDQLFYRASGLHLIVAAIVLWNMVYLSRAVDTLRSKGMEIPDEYLQHLWDGSVDKT